MTAPHPIRIKLWPMPLVHTLLRLLFSGLMVFSLTACADYPVAPLKTDLLTPQQIAARYSLDAQWWKAYADPDLDRLIETALQNNVDLARSAIAVNRALYQAKLLSVDLVPAFSANTGATSSKNIETGTPQRGFQSEFGLSYELDLWQKLRNAATAQEWEYQATIEDREAARLALLNSLVDVYFQLCYLDQAIRVTQISIDRYQRLLDLTRTKYQFGKVGIVEPLQSEQSLLAARTNMDNLRTRKNTAEQTLHDLLNAKPGEVAPLREMDILNASTAGVNLRVPVAALAGRPDIRAAEDRLQRAFKTLESDRAAWYPSVTVGSTISASSNSAGTYFDVPLLAGTVKVNFPFLQWNTVRWTIKISEADFETAKLNFIASVTGALNEVNAAYLNYTAAERILQNTTAKHERDVQISTYYRDRYDLGAAELKDYLDALNTEDASLLSQLEAKYKLISYENLIYKAMGGKYTEK